MLTRHPWFLRLDPDTLGRLTSFCTLVCGLPSKLHTTLFWPLSIKETSVHFSTSVFSVVNLDLIFHVILKRWAGAHTFLTVYHQRIIRKVLIYGNVAFTKFYWWRVTRAEENAQMTLLVHLLYNYLIIGYSKGCYAQKLKVFDIQPYPPINN